MDQQASQIIDILGGTAAVSELTCTPNSTVHSWRKIGLSPSRLDHIKLAAHYRGKSEQLAKVLGREAALP